MINYPDVYLYSHNQIQINTTRHKLILTFPFIHQPWFNNLPSKQLKKTTSLLLLDPEHTPLGPAFQDLVLERSVAVEQ